MNIYIIIRYKGLQSIFSRIATLFLFIRLLSFYDNIKYLLLMNLHIFCIPDHTILTIQFTIHQLWKNYQNY